MNCPQSRGYLMFDRISECHGLSDGSTVTVQPVAQRTPSGVIPGPQYMLFMAMAFKSVSDYAFY